MSTSSARTSDTTVTSILPVFSLFVPPMTTLPFVPSINFATRPKWRGLMILAKPGFETRGVAVVVPGAGGLNSARAALKDAMSLGCISRVQRT